MISTINEGDRIIASRLSYINDSPERYDIILFYFPDDESQIFVKRVIGLPGETVEVVNGITYITDADGNKTQADQSFIQNETPVGNYGPFYIPFKGEAITTDGIYCYAENGEIVGSTEFIEKYCKAVGSGNYTVSENCYFCMGDNRNVSIDSRDERIGCIAKSAIIGKVIFSVSPLHGIAKYTH